MYERLLVAVDHSEISGRVLAAAQNLASLAKAKVWVLHLREREVIDRMGLVPSESDKEAHAAVTSWARVAGAISPGWYLEAPRTR